MLDENTIKYGDIYEQATFMNEAYHGRQQVEPIRKAMLNIYEHLAKDPKWRIEGSPEDKALEAAFIKCFGFNRCTIYWRYVEMPFGATVTYRIPTRVKDFDGNRVYVPLKKPINTGPVSAPGAVLLPNEEKKRKDSSGGHYDKNHELNAVISMDQTYFFGDHALTSDEMVAVLLHETGHLFDASIFKVMYNWTPIYITMVNVANAAKMYGLSLTQTIKLFLTAEAPQAFRIWIQNNFPELAIYFVNLEEMLLSYLPPIREFAGFVGHHATKIYNTIQAFLRPVKTAAVLPASIMALPMNYVKSTLVRKSETYADSFAAQYGYGAELGTALAKLDKIITENGYLNDGILAPVYDLTGMFRIMLSAGEGHESTPERFQRCIRTLDKDLEDSRLNQAERKLIEDERDRIRKAYNDYINLPEEDKHFIKRLYLKIVDKWIQSKPYDLVQTMCILPDETYAD